MQKFAFPNAARRAILCLGAHADDIEIGCGGTLLKLLAERPGVAVHWIVFSASQQRAAEAAASATAFLAARRDTEIKMLAFRDSFFPHIWLEIKEQFAELGRGLARVDIHPSSRRRHQDHRLMPS